MLAWRSRLHENGPRLVCGVLAALLVIECARVIALSLRDNRPQPTGLRDRPFAANSSRLALRSIVDAHLFGVARAAALDPQSAGPAAADLQLHGTFATGDPHQGWAIITADGREELYGIGKLVGGAALFSVYADHVLLKRDGHLESVWLPRAIRPVRVAAIDGTVAERAPDGAHKIADIVRAEPEWDEESQDLIGFRISAVAPASGMLKAGLRPYDVVTAINGTLLTDQDKQHSQQILAAALASGSATLGIKRGSVHLDVAVELPR